MFFLNSKDFNSLPGAPLMIVPEGNVFKTPESAKLPLARFVLEDLDRDHEKCLPNLIQ